VERQNSLRMADTYFWYEKWQKERDPQALQQLFEHYEPFVRQMQSKWNAHFHPGVFRGLAKRQILQALKTYKPDKGARLDTHVYNYLQKLSRYAMSYGEAVRMPEHLRLKVGALMAAWDKLESQLGRAPTVDELADELNWTKGEVERIQRYMFEEKAVGGTELPQAWEAFDMESALIESVYQDLSPREKLVFEHTTGYGGKPILSTKEIAELLKTSPASVSRMRKQITEKFRQALGL